jgi:carbamoyltransferase
VYHVGISFGHNSTVAVVKDGRLVFCQSEERLIRLKNCVCFPSATLRQAYASVMRPDEVASVNLFSTDIRSFLILKRSEFQPVRFGGPLHAGDIADWQRDPAGADRMYLTTRISDSALNLNAALKQAEAAYFAEAAGVASEKLAFIDHHQTHVYSTLPFVASWGDDRPVLIFTLDGEGDGLAGSVSVLQAGRLTTLSTASEMASLGKIYMYVTGMLGFHMNEHEYKVMGLAPYAKPEYCQHLVQRFRELLRIGADGSWECRATTLPQLTNALAEICQFQRFDAVAGALQSYTEEIILGWIRFWVAKTGLTSIACAGGVFMNVKANQRIAELGEVERYVVVPSCGDESTAIGCAVAGSRHHQPGHPIEPVGHLYLGMAFDDAAVRRALAEDDAAARYEISEPDDINQAVAALLCDGKIVARCAGAMEFGARALGNRSILADPRRPDNLPIINNAIKNRDFWMPFAPTVLDEEFDAFVHDPGKSDARFMMVSFGATPRGRTELIAALHQADFTLRPQRLDAAANPDYHAIITAFRARTGTGAVLNTSFNLHGEPIVCSPLDALSTVDRSGLEYLCLNRYLLRKRGATDIRPPG